MRAMLVIDMQEGMLTSEALPKDVDVVVHRINQRSRELRSAGDIVIFLQHCGVRPMTDLRQTAPGGVKDSLRFLLRFTPAVCAEAVRCHRTSDCRLGH